MRPVEPLTAEEKTQVLNEVLQSNAFARSEQLRRFLRYICELEIAGRAQEINEYSIGIEALGRRPGYSTGDDSSVRSRAYALRQKLQEFYEFEQQNAAVRIELRKGSYTPHFLTQPEIVQGPQDSVAVPGKSSVRALWVFVAGFGAAALVAVAAVALFAFRQPLSAIDPVLREAWGTMLVPRADAVVCIASPPTMLLKSFKDGTLPAVPRLLPAPREVADWYAGLKMQDGGGTLYMQTTPNSALVGDTLAALTAIQLLTRAGASIQALPESGLGPLALRGRNVVLIGSPNYSPYAARILRSAPLSVRYDPVRREEVISDGPPDAGAKRVFRPRRDQFGQLTQVHGLLTVVPSQGGAQAGAQTVVVSGVTSAGPQAAMEFFCSPLNMKDLKARFQREGYSHLPRSYQVVVRCSIDRGLTLNWAYETHEIIRKPPLLD